MTINRKQSEELSFDFVVVGGGVGGLCAAIAAARHNVKTAIIQDRPMFGGNSSSEIRVAPLGAASFSAWCRETGILEELLLEERSRNHDHVNDGMASTHYDIVLFEAAKHEANLTMLLNTSLRGAEAGPVDPKKPDGERNIVAIHCSQLATEREFTIRARQFADCTGDATLGALAGAKFRWGRESRSEFGEQLAPVEADNQTMGSSLTMRARNIGRPAPFTPPEWGAVYKTLGEIGLCREPARCNRPDFSGFWWIEVGTPFNQIDDNQQITEELLKHVLGVWNYVKNFSPDKDEAANYALEWVGMFPGKRESRRLVGDVLMTEHDCHTDRQWPDRVAYSGWFIDLHTMGGILNKKEPGEPANVDANYREWVRVPPFSIPLRALYSCNVANLWMAGRNISVTHAALGSTRVMMTHALQGQAVGTAAAYALGKGLTPRQAADPAGAHISIIQQQLLKDDANPFGVPNADPADLARGAKVDATSTAVLDMTNLEPKAFQDLEVPRAMVFPVTHDRLKTIDVYLRNDTAEAIEVAAELQVLDQIWQKHAGAVQGAFVFKVPARHEGWVRADVNLLTIPGRPHRLCLAKTPGLQWALCKSLPTGAVQEYFHSCPGGCEPKYADLHTLTPGQTEIPAYESWLQIKWLNGLAIRLDPAPAPFGAENVNTGIAWPFVMPNLWVSDPAQSLPQSVTLSFEKEQALNTVLVSFDTNLRDTYHDMLGFHKARTCVCDWRLHALTNSGWQQVFEQKGNFKRRVRASFKTISASAIKLEVLSTNATSATDPAGEGRSARIYEIRVYKD